MMEIVLAIFASSGFWALIQTYYTKMHEAESNTAKMLKGLGFDRLMHLCNKYLEQGYITSDEYINLYKYLYEPYKGLGGDGVIDKIMQEVDKLEMK